MVDEAEIRLLDGCVKTFRKDLLSSEHLEISQIIIKGNGDAEDYGVGSREMMFYALNGKASLKERGTETDIRQGDLMVVLPGVPWGPGLSVISDQLTLLEIASKVRNQSADPSSESEPCNHICIIKPESLPTYPPAGHFKTINRCLFLNENVEIIEGSIESGGGAERHFHPDHEQMLYVLEGSPAPLLIYYPKGVPHGTAGSISTNLKLLVIYSPPLGESQNALG
jgi:hypothetical protein